MQSPRTKDFVSEATPDDVFDAVLGVVQNDDSFTLFGVNNEHHRVMFTTGKTATSWGREFVAETSVIDDTTVTRVLGGGIAGRPKALLDPWKNGRAVDRVVNAVKAVLDGTQTAPAQPVRSFVTTPDGGTEPWTDADYRDF